MKLIQISSWTEISIGIHIRHVCRFHSACAGFVDDPAPHGTDERPDLKNLRLRLRSGLRENQWVEHDEG